MNVPRWALAGSLFFFVAGGISASLYKTSSAPPFSDSSKPIPGELEGMYEELIEQAHESIEHNNLKMALMHLESIPVNSESFGTAQQLKEEVSGELLERAMDKIERGDLSRALAMVKAVPLSSLSYSQAQKLNRSWSQAYALLKSAQAAIAKGDWQSASTQLERLKGSPVYQSASVQKLVQQAHSHVGQRTTTGGNAIAKIPVTGPVAIAPQVADESPTVARALTVKPEVKAKQRQLSSPPTRTSEIAGLPDSEKPASNKTQGSERIVAISPKVQSPESEAKPNIAAPNPDESEVNQTGREETVVVEVGDILSLAGLGTNPYIVEAMSKPTDAMPLERVASTEVATLNLPSEIVSLIEGNAPQAATASMSFEEPSENQKMGSATSMDDFTNPLASVSTSKGQTNAITAAVLKAVSQITAWYGPKPTPHSPSTDNPM